MSRAATETPAAPAALEQQRRERSLYRKTHVFGYLFIAPWVIGFLVFTVGPMIASLWMSFTKYNLADMEYIGLRNYEYLLARDPLFWKSLWNTAIYVLVSVPIGLTGSLLLAMLLNFEVRGMSSSSGPSITCRRSRRRWRRRSCGCGYSIRTSASSTTACAP